jgi:hypothetical protein
MPDSTEVIQSGGLLVYTEPYSSGNSFPADSAWGTAPGGSWVDKGYTRDGLAVNMGMNYEDVTVDQVPYPIFSIGTSGDIHFVTNLAQITAPNLKEVLGGQGTISTVAAGSGTRGHTDLLVAGELSVNYLSVYYDIKHPGDNEGARFTLWKAQARANQAMTFQRTAPAQLAFDAQGFPDTANSSRIVTFRDVIPALP